MIKLNSEPNLGERNQSSCPKVVTISTYLCMITDTSIKGIRYFFGLDELEELYKIREVIENLKPEFDKVSSYN